MGKKSKKKEEVYHVEVITQARVTRSPSSDEARWEYYVKWATYPDSENSWEPEKNLKAGCGRLLTSFWQHVGMDNEDYQVGYVVKAKQDWIESEKAFFKAEFDKVLEKERDEEKSKKRKRARSREAPESASTISEEKAASKEKSPSSSDSEEERPLIESSSNLRIKIPKKVIFSPEPEEMPSSPRPHKIQKRHPGDFSIKNIIGGIHSPQQSPQQSPPNSPQQSPTSLFSDPSSPENFLSSKLPLKARTTSAFAARAKPQNTRRVIDPQAKIASMPTSALVTNSGIMTKQRIAQGALDPTPPKDVTTIKPTPKPLPGRTNTLMNLTFKKHSIPTSFPPPTAGQTESTAPGLRSPMVNDPTLASLNSPSAHSPQILSNAFSSIAKPNASPNVIAEQRITQLNKPPRKVDAISPALLSSPSQSMAAAEDFLQSMMPPSLAGPLQPAPEALQEPMPPKPLIQKSILPLPGRQPRTWTWTGPLCVNSVKKSVMYNVKIQLQQSAQDKGLGFSVVFQNMEKIRISSFYDIADFRANLNVFQTVTPLALLTSNEDKDPRRFNILARYLQKAKKIFLTPVILDNNCIGQISFFPYAHHFLVLGKNINSLYDQPNSLVAAIMPFTLSPDHMKEATRLPRTSHSSHGQSDHQNLYRFLPESNLDLQHGLRILGFPYDLFSYIKASASGRSFCIWSDRPRRKSPDIETHYLTRILEKTRAPHVAYNAEARLVFVHAAALPTLHKLHRFAERRTQHQKHVQFYVYGTKTDISPKMMPVREIYPCGGIVTFTPFVMRSDPLGVLLLMRRIDDHPLWASYIIPSALGLLAKLECGQTDPISLLDKKPLMVDVILEAIAAGQTSLLHAPPEEPTLTRVVKKDMATGEEKVDYLDDNLEWIKRYFSFAPPRKFDALATGITAFLANTRLSKSEGAAYMTVMDDITIADMTLMQRNPALMTSYRRYVVIDSDTHPLRQNPYVQGLEWTSLSKFDFKDGFYTKQTS